MIVFFCGWYRIILITNHCNIDYSHIANLVYYLHKNQNNVLRDERIKMICLSKSQMILVLDKR